MMTVKRMALDVLNCKQCTLKCFPIMDNMALTKN